LIVKPLLKVDKKFYKAKVNHRLNRFTLMVDFGKFKRKAYLQNPGGLSTVLRKGRKVLLLKVDKNQSRKNFFDVFAIKVGKFYVTVQSTFANKLFEAAVKKGFLKDFKNCEIVGKERKIDDYGKIDFLLNRNGKTVLVEVKSCTYMEDGIAKFPDKPTNRGRKHVKQLAKLTVQGFESWIVFVVQRPDAVKFKPYWQVDKNFAETLVLASKMGVKILAFTTNFQLNRKMVYLVKPSIPTILVENC